MAIHDGTTDGTPQAGRRRLGPGSVIANRYLLVEIIGQGGAGIVFSAQQLDLERMVALKILAVDPRDDRMGERLQREARLVAGIHHPALTQIYESGVTDDGRPFIAMELLEGESLAARLQRVGRLAPREAVEIAAQIGAGLGVVHAKGYVHRDVKPGNVFLARAGVGEVVKLLDFGTVRRLDLGDTANDAVVQRTLLGLGKPTIKTLNGVVFGTPWYMSPEQAAGLPLGARSDEYSLGVVIYEMLTGTLPFDDELAGRVVAKHIAEVPEPMSVRAVDAGIPSGLEAVVMRALAKHPDERFATVGDFASALFEALTSRLAPAGPAAEPVTVPGTRRSVLALLAVLGLLATLGALAWLEVSSAPYEASSATSAAVSADPSPVPRSAERTVTPSRLSLEPVVSPVVERTVDTKPHFARAPANFNGSAAEPRALDYSLPELKPLHEEETSP